MNIDLVWPVFGMILLSFSLMPMTAAARFSAVFRRKMKPSQFKLVDLENAPEFVLKTTRHWSNLYEVPVLFYVMMSITIALQWQDRAILYAAWAYVALRYVHCAIHLTYNYVPHRFAAFFSSNICLIIIFVRLILRAASFSE